MSWLVLFFCNCLLFFPMYRTLTVTDAKPAAVVRTALFILLTFFASALTLWAQCTPWSLLAVTTALAVACVYLPGEGLSKFTAALGGLRFTAYLLSVFSLAALVLIFVPITTFLTSPGELSVHLDYLFSTNARDAMLIVYVAALIYALAMTQRIRTMLTLLALGALALGLIYSYVLPFGYPMMSGLAFEQLPTSLPSLILRAALDVAIVAVVMFTLPITLVRFGARPIVVGILLINVSLAVAVAVGIFRDDVGGAGGPAVTAELSVQPLRFSPTEKNVLVIFLDRFMGSYVESILKSDPQLAEQLSGFTWYARSVSAGENSIAGVHPMLGGYDYTPFEMNSREKPLRDLSVEAFSILPVNFARKGYRVNMVNPRGLGFTMAGDCGYLKIDNVFCTHISYEVAKRRALQMGFSLEELSSANYADLLVLLGSMRAAPYALKEVLYRAGPWRPFMNHVAGNTFKEWAELEALGELSYTTAQEPNMNFVSNILPHEPYYMGEDCTPRHEQLRMSDEEVRQRGHASLFSLQHAIAARCALLSVAKYVDFLKNAGVYANTKIVIVSDHGIVGPVNDTSTRAIAGRTQGNLYVRTRSLLLVKEVNADGPLRISDTFMPNAELPRIVCEEIGGCSNPYLGGKTIAAHGRDDPFNVALVPWQFSLQEPKAFVINKHLILKGKDPYNARNWTVQ